jgi:hypothetical protein
MYPYREWDERPGAPSRRGCLVRHIGLRADRKERLDLLNANHFGNDADSLSGSPMALISTQ